MKLTLKLNIGNYQNIDIETNEHETRVECYVELLAFLNDWRPITNNAEILTGQLRGILERLNYINEKEAPG